MADHFFLRIFMAYHLAWLMYYSFWLLNLQVHLAFFFFSWNHTSFLSCWSASATSNGWNQPTMLQFSLHLDGGLAAACMQLRPMRQALALQ
jgi:hypothetical protein